MRAVGGVRRARCGDGRHAGVARPLGHVRGSLGPDVVDGDLLEVRTTKGRYVAKAVLLAIGRRGTPRKLGVPGEELPKVTYRLSDPVQYRGMNVLVVGGGPSGAACAYWLAEAGHRVLVVEKKRFPREKTCGDGLTPRAVRQLNDMGLAPALADHRRIDGLRSIGHGITLELAWPEHPDFPSYGYVVRRRELDAMVAGRAAEAGAEVRWSFRSFNSNMAVLRLTSWSDTSE